MLSLSDVSVVMPAFHAAGTIKRALLSIAAQTKPPKEIIVVDDGSDDGTADVAENLASHFIEKGTALKIIRQNNLGPGAARNRAIRESSNLWLAFLDADDEWMPRKLERSLAVAEAVNANIVSHDFITIDNSKESIANCARHCPQGQNPLPPQFLKGFIANSTVIARRDLVVALGGFDSSLRSGQDYELWLTAAADSRTRFAAFPEALTLYHITPGSISTHVELRRRAALVILHRHWKKLRGHVRSPLLIASLRVLIIHLQAAQAYAGQGRHLAALSALLMAPAGLLMLLGAPETNVRPDGIAAP